MNEDNDDFASTRSVQIATNVLSDKSYQQTALPPHAPCRLQQADESTIENPILFASTRSVQIATPSLETTNEESIFASTRSVQIATFLSYST